MANMQHKEFKLIRSQSIEALHVIAEEYEQSDYLLAPHTAIGVEAGRQCRRSDEIPMIALATAHPISQG